jgi:ATP-binding cassette subfamily B protein
LVLNRALTPGDLLVFLTYLRRAFHPLQDFAKYTARLAKATAAGERVIEILEKRPEITDIPGAMEPPPFHGEVCFENVTFGYESHRNVLEEITFAASPGQSVALVGPSGIGKSTFVHMILRLYDPQGGCVRIDGTDIRRFKLDSLRMQVGVVLQDTILFAASVWDNIAMGAPGVCRDEIRQAAQLASALDFITTLPSGFDTVLGERGVTLSHGQRQRIAVARAAVRKARILILDEPTASLDEENEQAVIEALHRLSIGRTTFLITHNLPFASTCDLILYLENGRIAEQGSHNQLLHANGRYAALYALQSQRSTKMERKGEPNAVAL